VGVEPLETRQVPSTVGTAHPEKLDRQIASSVVSVTSPPSALHPHNAVRVASSNSVSAESALEHYFFFAFQQIPDNAVATIKHAQGRFASNFDDAVQINGQKGLHISVVRIGVIPDSRAPNYFNAASTYVAAFIHKYGDPRFDFYDKSGASLVRKGDFVAYNAYLTHDSTDFLQFATGLVNEIRTEIKKGNPSTLAAEKGQPHISILHFNDSASDDIGPAIRNYNDNPKNPKLTFQYRATTLYLMVSLPDHQYRAVNAINL
jgi:hypothetical protein